jgi:hypothetical protein
MKYKLTILCLFIFTLPLLAAPWHLEADLLEYIPQEDRALAQGAVFFQWDDFTLTGKSLDLFLKEDKAVLKEAQGQGAGLYFKAGEVVKNPQTTELHLSQLTGCSLPEPEYLLFSKQVSITDERIYLRGNKLRLFSLPRIPLPPLSFPRDTQLPLPTPRFGNSDTRGLWGGIAIPNFLDKNRKGTFTVLGSTKKGLILSQELEYTPGPWRADFALRWEDGIWGGVKLTRGPWLLVAELQTWSQAQELPLSTLPELRYSTGGKIRGLSITQSFSASSLKEGQVQRGRFRSQTSLSGKWNLGSLKLAMGGLLTAAHYGQERMLALSSTGTLSRLWQLDDGFITAFVGGTSRLVDGSTPFLHDRLTPGLDLTYGGSIKRGDWQFEVSKASDLLRPARFQASLRKDGHCFYWQIGYDEERGALSLKVGMR